MEVSQQIKKILYDKIYEVYQDYIKSSNILLIKKNNLPEIIEKLYEKNVSEIKKAIRQELKNLWENDNKAKANIENIILDIFQDKKINIEMLIEQITLIQENNFKILNVPIIENSINLNINLTNNYIIINKVNVKNIDDYSEIYEELSKYKFIYSIEDKILDEYEEAEKINIIKSEIINKTNISLGVYYLNKNNE